MPAKKTTKKTAKARRTPTPNPTRKKGRKPPAAPKTWQALFLEELAHSGNVSAAARQAKVNRDTPYALRTAGLAQQPTPEAAAFAKDWDAALEISIDALELEARRRAVAGVSEPVGWYRGAAGGTVRRYSDTLLIVLLKAHRPAKYRETVRQEMTGPGGGPLEVRAVDYRTAIAALAPGPMADRPTPGEGQSAGDGAAVGQDRPG